MMESILLVDDQQANLQVLLETLGSIGCKLLVAKNGEAALSVAEKARPDLILLDIMMPGIDGFEVCRRLKSNPAMGKTPIIFLSALDETADKVRGLQLGAIDYITKPFQPEEVIARVNTHLTIHRLGREVQKQKDALEQELQTISQLQRDLLPERLPRLEGLELAVHYETSRYAGGDYYDLAELPDGRLAVLIADAEGHSAPATVMMAMACALFRSNEALREHPDRMISFINENLCKVNKESFVTALYGVYDTRLRTMTMARAAHPLPILYRASDRRAVEIDCDGVTFMGWDKYTEVPVTEIRLDPGDRLLFYTDGITERFNAQREAYGTERLLRQLGTIDSDDPVEIVERIVGDLERFAQGSAANDDQAMVLLRAG